MQQKKNSRQQRVATEIKKVLSDFLFKCNIFDEDFACVQPALISITDVVVSSCLKHAKVFVVSISNKFSNEDGVSFLQKHSPRLRYHLGSNLRLKSVPDLQFFVDDSFETAEKIESLLRNISTGDQTVGYGAEA
ncbi:ribosome-binding factor A [Alphaproteobacteria bacterium]|nr:ribosome-binding factor A [Alphaproteobacteria bacterium]